MKDEGTNFRAASRSEFRQPVMNFANATTPSCWPSVRRSDATPVPGRELNGIHQAMEYLPQSNRVALGRAVENQITAKDKHVVIIGGGDTGADCLGTAIRQQAKSIVQLEILPTPPDERPEHQPWPTYPMIYRVSSAHEEAGSGLFGVHHRVPGRWERQRQLAHDLRSDVPGGKLTPIEGTEREIPAELVLLAMGFVGPETDTVVSQLGVALDEREQHRARPQRRDRRRPSLRLRGCRPRPVVDRLGHRRGQGLCGRGGRVPLRIDQAAPAHPAHRTPDDGLTPRSRPPL